MDRQLAQIGNKGLYERRLHVGVHRSLVRKRLDEVQDRFVIGIDSHDARPSQGFDIWAQLHHAPGKLGLLPRLCLETDIDMNRLGHLILSNGHRSSAEVVSVGAEVGVRNVLACGADEVRVLQDSGTGAGHAAAGKSMPYRLNQLPAPAGIAFDLDGTLVDTVGSRIDGWLEALAAAGMHSTRDEVAPLIGMDGKRLAREVAEANHRRVTNDEIEKLDRAAGEAFDRLNTCPRPLPGVGDLFGAIESHGLRWVIATSSRAEQVTRSVAALGLAVPPAIVDGSQVKRAKPAPDLLLLAAQRLCAPANRCWAVGDATWDIRASRAAGLTAIGVLAGSAVDRSALEEAGAALVVETLSELVELLDGARERSRETSSATATSPSRPPLQ